MPHQKGFPSALPTKPDVELRRPARNHRGDTLPPPEPPLYSLDSLHPDRLGCDRCGHALPVALDACDDLEALRLLTEDEAAAYCTGLAADLRLHAMCSPGAWFGGQGA